MGDAAALLEMCGGSWRYDGSLSTWGLTVDVAAFWRCGGSLAAPAGSFFNNVMLNSRESEETLKSFKSFSLF